ncbi:MAG: ATP-binding protein [Chloroflexi bacterium AL-N1]|nr:ATP-binding protein [Chloroflexi bacterium AL-N1]NOK77321.1 ATP-binding protein [Chloroflexi bacterium AL-N5]
MQDGINPFTERGRITDPHKFTGRWGELSLLFERLEGRRPVLITGSPGIGKSSLLTHVSQSASATLELPDLQSFYLNLQVATNATEVYGVVVQALRQKGDTPAGLDVALITAGLPVLLCLDDAQTALAAGWGTELLEELARISRRNPLFVVVAMNGTPPALSERFATIGLGAFAMPEVRLFAEAYLDDTGVVFTSGELHSIAEVSQAHPAYLQRAAFHLFQSKLQPELNWRAAYLAEAREKPIPGAPLPPEVFEGKAGNRVESSRYADGDVESAQDGPVMLPLPEVDSSLVGVLLVLIGVLLFIVTNSTLILLVVAGIGVGLFVFLRQRRLLRNRRLTITTKEEH